MLLPWLLACSETGVSPVTTENRPPSLGFETPSADGEELPACETLRIVAIAHDGDDPDASLRVMVSLDGAGSAELVRTGARWTLRVDALEPGSEHAVHATVTDPEGLITRADTSFRVAQNTAPDPWFLSPANMAKVVPAEPLAVLVDVADPEGDTVALAWRLDGAPIDGPASADTSGRAGFDLELVDLDGGLHTLELDASDPCGAVATTSTRFALACAEVWYADADGDDHGDPGSTVQFCEPPPGHVASADDCDDTDASVFPGAPEWCNGRDDDCDGEIDEEASDPPAWYRDADGDGYGDRDDRVYACEAPEGYVTSASDCDDADSGVTRCPGNDDGTICPGLIGADDGKVPSYPGWCDTSLGFVEDDGRCYYAVTDRTTWWEDARASCMAAGGYLATATSSDESDFLYGLAGRTYAGACDADTEGTFTWISGEAWSFEDFGTGEPNDMGGEDCFEITGSGDGYWNDIWCGYVSFGQAYACEFE